MSCSRLNPQHFCILRVVGSHESALTLAHYKEKSLWERMRIALKTCSFWNDISCWFVHSLNLFTSKGKDLSLIYWFLEFLLWITFSDLSSFFFLVLLKLSFEKSVFQLFSSLIQGHSKLQLLFKNRFLILIRWYLSFPLMVYILTSNYSLPWSHKETLFYIVF